jgi:trehalose/maltose hydrolase-like predicted phosphorylase
MFAWESANTGDETTPKVGAIDFKTKKPIPILCGDIEQHITADIAYAIAQYLEVTGDREFLQSYGAEIVLLGARFWASRAQYSETQDCYEIKDVIGPDEYKEHVDNNFYTNYLVQQQLRFSLELLKDPLHEGIVSIWDITEEEAVRWADIAEKIRLPKDGDRFEQFEGFLKLKEIDVLRYRETPGALQKVHSWREINEAQVLKQADVVMLLHLFADRLTDQEKQANWDFYEPKTMHDSSLSAAIHSVVASDLGLSEEAYAYFRKASRIDLGNALMNSAHGLHAAALGGLWQATVQGFAGVRVNDQVLTCNPQLPKEWDELTFKLQLQGTLLNVTITQEGLAISVLELGQPIAVQVGASPVFTLDQEQDVTLAYKQVQEECP